jgi:hypothetical protein
MKKLFSLAMAFALVLGSNCLLVNAAELSSDISEEIQPSESIIVNDSDTIHTVTLQHIDPIKEGDDYGWMLESESGQLGYSLNALGLGNPNPELFGNDTIMLFSEEGIELEEIYDKLDLDNTRLLENSTSFVITYTQEDIGDYVAKAITNVGGKDDISIRTTGSFSKTLKSNQNSETSAQEKDDNEQVAYLTITTLAPTAFQYFNGI